MWSGQPTGLPGIDARERARLEVQVLVLQVGIAAFFSVGAYLGVFGVDGAIRTWTVGWIVSYHVFHTWYVLRFRMPGRPLAWVEFATPLCDVTCITAGWIAIGDHNNPLWAVYLYALVGYARRYEGLNYAVVAGFIVANLVAGRVLISLHAATPTLDGNLLTMVFLTGAMAVLAHAIGGAWRRAERKARRLAETDPLTGIANRRTFLERLADLAADEDGVFSVLMLDLDDFKRLNDDHGHLFGDQVLVNVSRTLSECIRPEDRLARYGGEEFVVAMPGTSLNDAIAVAERLRQAVAETTPTSVSVGCAARRPGETAESVLRRADDLLLTAKRNGKNSVRSGPLRRSA
ncbi:MAG: hypothetical protein C0506_06180 [Anaerolinea sp.]|nr:hypothetical protein [Anaerolinea sp.]